MIRVYLLTAVWIKSLGDHNSLFNEVSCVDYIFSVKFAEFFEVWQSFQFTLYLCTWFYVGISLTIFDCVPKLLAAHTPSLFLQPLILIVIHLLVVFIVRIFFTLVLTVLAARLIFVSFSAAPPHLATPIGLMRSARPIEIFFLFELLVALLAGFSQRIIVALPSHNLLDSWLQLVFLFVDLFDVAIEQNILVHHFLYFSIGFINGISHPLEFVLIRNIELLLLVF